jgi:anti-sigma B factor antagonist
MNFTIEYKDKIAIFILKEKTIESKISAELKAQMLILAQPDIDALVVDLSNVEAIDSSGLGGLLLAHRQLVEFNIPLIITGCGGFVKSLMEMTRIDELFEFADTIEEAITALQNK